MLRKFPSIPRLLRIFTRIFSKAFAASIYMIVFFSSFFLHILRFTDWLYDAELALLTYKKSHLFVLYNSFCPLLGSVCSYLLKTFISMFMRDIVYSFFFLYVPNCFWYQGNAGLMSELGVSPFFPFFRRDCGELVSFHPWMLVEFISETTWFCCFLS